MTQIIGKPKKGGTGEVGERVESNPITKVDMVAGAGSVYTQAYKHDPARRWGENSAKADSDSLKQSFGLGGGGKKERA